MEKAEKLYGKILDANSNGKWKPTISSLEKHASPEWFQDIKFGMFINWGPWSIAGWDAKKEKGAMYPDWYEWNLDYKPSDGRRKYHEKNWGRDFERDDLIPFFKAQKYQPERLVDIAAEAGIKYIIPFSKHHSGFCLWPSSYTRRNAGEILGKDLVKPLADRCREKGLMFGFYFSVDDWEHPVIDSRGDIVMRKWGAKYEPYMSKLETWASGKIAVKDFSKHYIIPQAVEFIDNYDPDILWYDGEWDSPVESMGTYEIAAYYYNHAEGRKEVAINDRYGLINGKKSRAYLGDFFCSEYGSLSSKNKARHAWEECRGISQSFGFNWQDTDENVVSSKELVGMLVDIVSKGGNLLLVVNLDAQGALPEIQEKRLKDMGKWLNINQEAIYNTRRHSVDSEGCVRYTRAKDNQSVYAISLEWPGDQLKLTSIKPSEISQIHMLGHKESLKWSYQNGITTITLPAELQDAANRPCDYAYTFRIRK